MTLALKKAFREASSLPAELQEQIAAQLMEDIAAERAWDSTLAREDSQLLLKRMAEKAMRDHAEGKTHLKGFDEL